LALSPGSCTGFTFFFPGLHVVESSPERALAALPEAVRAELEWLADCGVELPQRNEPIEIWEVERIDLSTDVSRGRWVGAFRYERRPTTPDDVALALARTDLVRSASREALETLDPRAAAEAEPLLSTRADDILVLLTRLGTRPDIQLPATPRERWEAASRLTEERLHNLLPGDRERHAVFEGEEWTTRKVLRTLAVGERALYARLAEIAGVPVPFSFGGSAARGQAPR
jgi:hypothetical protein